MTFWRHKLFVSSKTFDRRKSVTRPFEKKPLHVVPRPFLFTQGRAMSLRLSDQKFVFELLIRFKSRILHAPSRIAKLSVCKMRRLHQFKNATYLNLKRVSRIFD